MRRARSSSPFLQDQHHLDQVDLPSPEEIHFYIRRTQPNFGNHSSEGLDASNLKKEIDLIPRDHVACLKIDALCYELLKITYLSNALARGVRYMVSDKHPQQMMIPTVERGSPEFKEALRKKKIQDRTKPPTLTARVSAAFRELMNSCGLFSFYGAIFPAQPELLEWVSGFFVAKSSGLLRVITDARWSNVHFQRPSLQFSMFSFGTLRQVIDNLSYGGTSPWYVANLDLRHWFHQIPLPHRYQKYFGIPLTDRGNDEGDYILIPNAAPMGWLASPFGAQSLTWSLVLLREDTAVPKGLNRPGLESQTTPFTWIPFKNGGGIFVILDNILIVSPDKDERDFWLNNTLRNCKKFNAKLKTSLGEKETDPDVIAAAVEKECCFTMTPTCSESFNFHGVDWYYNYHVVRVKKGEDHDLPNCIGHKNMPAESSPWKGTRRQLSSILGLLNWHRTVHGLKDYNDPERFHAFRKLYRVMTPPIQDNANWDEEITINDRGILKQLIAAWRLRGSETPCRAAPLAFKPSTVVQAATDAATNEEKGPNGRVSSNPRVAAIIFKAEDPKKPEVSAASKKPEDYEDVCEEPFRSKDYHIALGELQGILLAVRRALSKCSNALIVLATDSMVAKHWVESGNTRVEAALGLLKELDELLTDSGSRLYLVYIPTKDNLADVPSRKGEGGYWAEWGNYSRERKATRALLESAAAEARKTFIRDGGKTGGVAVVASK